MIVRSLAIRGLVTFGSLLIAAVFVIGPFVDACFAQVPLGPSQLSEMTDMLIGSWCAPAEKLVYGEGGLMTSYSRGDYYRGTFRVLQNLRVENVFPKYGATIRHLIRVVSATHLRLQKVGTTKIFDYTRCETCVGFICTPAQEVVSRWGDRQYVDGHASGKVPTAAAAPKTNSGAADYEAVIRGAVRDSIRRGTPSDAPSSTLSPSEQQEMARQRRDREQAAEERNQRDFMDQMQRNRNPR